MKIYTSIKLILSNYNSNVVLLAAFVEFSAGFARFALVDALPIGVSGNCLALGGHAFRGFFRILQDFASFEALLHALKDLLVDEVVPQTVTGHHNDVAALHRVPVVLCAVGKAVASAALEREIEGMLLDS